jgi:hypothetical protein
VLSAGTIYAAKPTEIINAWRERVGWDGIGTKSYDSKRAWSFIIIQCSLVLEISLWCNGHLKKNNNYKYVKKVDTRNFLTKIQEILRNIIFS